MNCVACGERCEDRGRFCPFCGVLLRIACTHCGQLNCRSQTACSRCSTPLSTALETTAATVPPGRPLERRQLTIMFSDLVNSTALSDQLDPEDFRVLIEAHRTAAAVPIKRYGGVVARYLGDGMLVYFGYPEAHEDDPDRAVRAGLEIVEATRAMNERWIGEGRGKIAVRIGIHTGIVVVGDVIKEDVQEPMAVFGNPPSLAARLQALAQPNAVVLSGATKALLRPTVRCLPRGQTILKGIANPVEIYMANETEGRSIGEPAAGSGRKVLPFVNREKELSALRLGWISAKKGEGRAFLLAGDPGIGKSRLIRALEERVVSKPFRWLVARTSPYATNSDFFAFSELFHGLLQPAELKETNADGYALLKDVLVGQGLAESNQALGFANLLGIESPEDAAPRDLQPERLRDLTLGAITVWFEHQSADAPLVLVIEDLHWADASTLEAIKLLLKALPSTHILLVMSSREHGVLGDVQDQVEKISVERLPPDYAKTLLDHVVQEADLPETSLNTLLERAAGVPLYIEELPKPVLEGGGGGRAAGFDQGSDPAALPATLRDSLMAQLDRMGDGKSVAQTGAVLGHSFDEALMRRVYGGSLRQMEEGLETLTEAGLLTRNGASPAATYGFKHALLAEIAYDSLLRVERRQIHRRTADALVAHFPTLAESRPELIARHYAAANDSLIAFDYWMKAGKAAARRSANTEAIGHFRSAEAELETLRAARAEDQDENRWLDLYASRTPVLIALFGWSAQVVEDTYRARLKLVELQDSKERDQFDAWMGLCNVYSLRGHLVKAREAADKMYRIAKKIDDEDLVIRWYRSSGFCDFLSAKFENAVDQYEASLNLKKNGSDAHSTTRYEVGVGSKVYPIRNLNVISYSIKAWAHCFLGQFAKSSEASAIAIETAERAKHPFSLGYALCLASSLAQSRNQPALAKIHADKALILSEEFNFPYWSAWAKIIKGWSAATSGDPIDGIGLLKEGLEAYENTNAAQMRGYALCLLAEAYQHVDRWQNSVNTAETAVYEMVRTGIVFYLPEAYRLLGQGIGNLDANSKDCQVRLVNAVRIARRSRSRWLLFKASYSLIQRTDRPTLCQMAATHLAETKAYMRQECDQSEIDLLEKEIDLTTKIDFSSRKPNQISI